jgi:hypothetical protein
VPDLLVCHVSTNVIGLVEVKTLAGQLTEEQVEWHGKGWPVFIVRCVEDVPEIVRRLR